MEKNIQPRSEETRTKILAKAEELFALQGYDATGVQDICDAAKVSKGAFYHHFPTKLSVFQTLLTGWLTQLDDQLKLANTTSADISAVLLSMAAAIGPVFEEARPRTHIILEYWIQAGRNPELWQTAVAPFKKYLDFFTVLLDLGARQGVFYENIDQRAGSRVVIAFVMGLLLQSYFDPKGADWSELTVQGMQMILHGFNRRNL
jgi:AcrR family transcriptional regulator